MGALGDASVSTWHIYLPVTLGTEEKSHSAAPRMLTPQTFAGSREPKPCYEQGTLGIIPSLVTVASASDGQGPGETPLPPVSGFGFVVSQDGNKRL